MNQPTTEQIDLLRTLARELREDRPIAASMAGRRMIADAVDAAVDAAEARQTQAQELAELREQIDADLMRARARLYDQPKKVA